jgi:excisionase family DNA binding protein
MKRKATQAPPAPAALADDVPYTVEEIAAFLRVSPWTVRRRMDAKLLPFYRDGDMVRITGAQLKTYLAKIAQGQPTQQAA